MRAENSKLTELKAVGVDMESAIYQGFKSIFEELSRFLIYCKLTFTLGKHTHTHTHTHTQASLYSSYCFIWRETCSNVWVKPEAVFAKTVPRCQGYCGKKITQIDGMLIKTYGTTRWTDKSTGDEMSKYGPMYIHLNETCLKRHTKKYYRPDEKFDYSIITLAQETSNNLSDEEK